MTATLACAVAGLIGILALIGLCVRYRRARRKPAALLKCLYQLEEDPKDDLIRLVRVQSQRHRMQSFIGHCGEVHFIEMIVQGRFVSAEFMVKMFALPPRMPVDEFALKLKEQTASKWRCLSTQPI